MDRAEAIEYLEPIATSAVLPRYKEALGVAISALKEESEDIIPLTFEKLRRMEGQPVWCELREESRLNCWGIVHDGFVDGYHANFFFEDYESRWLAYRKKP